MSYYLSRIVEYVSINLEYSMLIFELQLRYDSPGLFPKLRKAKSMQPKDDAEMAKQMELAQKRRKRRLEREQTRNMTGATSTTNDSPAVEKAKMPRPVPLDYYNSPKMEALRLKRLQEKKEYANNLMKIIDEMGQVDSGDEVDVPDPAGDSHSNSMHNSSLSSEDFNTPLAKRLVNKLRKERRRKPRANGLDADMAASESEVSMRVVETDENDISGVESIKPRGSVSTPNSSVRTSSQEESLQLKRRLIITDDVEVSDEDNSSPSGGQKPEEKVKPRSGHACVCLPVL